MVYLPHLFLRFNTFVHKILFTKLFKLSLLAMSIINHKPPLQQKLKTLDEIFNKHADSCLICVGWIEIEIPNSYKPNHHMNLLFGFFMNSK